MGPVGLFSHHEFFDDVEEILKGEWLGQKSIDTGLICGGFILRVSRHGNKADTDMLLFDAFKQIEPGFSGKLDFGQHDVDRTTGLHIGFESLSILK